LRFEKLEFAWLLFFGYWNFHKETTFYFLCAVCVFCTTYRFFLTQFCAQLCVCFCATNSLFFCILYTEV